MEVSGQRIMNVLARQKKKQAIGQLVINRIETKNREVRGCKVFWQRGKSFVNRGLIEIGDKAFIDNRWDFSKDGRERSGHNGGR